MNILLCNDDGISASGITAIASELTKIGKVWVAAPDAEKSAASNSITLSHPLRVKEIAFPAAVEKAFAISGTPADCAKIALSTLMPVRPDVVVSGINRGPNMCVDIFYSGTVAAAFEGAFKGILSVAISLDSYDAEADYTVAAMWGARCVERLVEAKAPSNRVYNINVPGIKSDAIKGIRVTRSGIIDYREIYDHRLDPYGKSYYWIKGNPEIIDAQDDFDVVAVKNGYVSITPLKPDLSDPDLMTYLSGIGLQNA